MSKRTFKRVVVIADLHCGHRVGLTHPDFNVAPPRGSKRWPLYVLRRRLWKFYAEAIGSLKPIDALIVNGDAVDGKGQKSGSTELITADRDEQAEMAAAAILHAEAGLVVMSYGTPYHTGASEDWENAVAKEVSAAKIGGHDWLDVNGLVFDYRHYVGRSIIPHGRHTSVSRERLWNLLWAEWDEYPKAQVFLRSHVHYFNFCGGYKWLALTTPALQGPKTKFGTRQSTGTVDFGIVSFDVVDREEWTWRPHIDKPRRSRQNVITV